MPHSAQLSGAYSHIGTWFCIYQEGHRRHAVSHEASFVNSERNINTYLVRTPVLPLLERLLLDEALQDHGSQEMVIAVIPARGPCPAWLLPPVDSGSIRHFHPHPPPFSHQERHNDQPITFGARAFKVCLDSASIETALSMTCILVERATRREDERNLRGGTPLRGDAPKEFACGSCIWPSCQPLSIKKKKFAVIQTHRSVTMQLWIFSPKMFKGCTDSGGLGTLAYEIVVMLVFTRATRLAARSIVNTFRILSVFATVVDIRSEGFIRSSASSMTVNELRRGEEKLPEISSQAPVMLRHFAVFLFTKE
ncbi:uncharacterized protein ARMOST_16769 [Armillaria ostoyae]|uniref:Uncharacterized protein n=1 Tax=Armillaria ostoyae TaxID=47428 RepID=A0A284RX77_ARMOS|nr:uncharacterized protein ARMOST_16769 [Armillaria ostoyae]